MGNILNHNKSLFDFSLTDEDYWDFHLSQEVGYKGAVNGLTTECLSAYIDFNDPNCIFWNDVFSKDECVWKSAINEETYLDYVGFTGVDNGFISYDKDKITNKEFLELFLHSKHNILNDELKLRLRKVNGNNQIYDYSNDITSIDGKDVSKLNGGFYQGFFKIFDKKYQVLPHILGDGLGIEVRLKKSDFVNDNVTINDTHKENKGIFLYIGTRAENKWWERYSIVDNFDKSNTEYSNGEYFEDEYTTENSNVNSRYADDTEDVDYIEIMYGNDGKNCNIKKEDTLDSEYYQVDDDCLGYVTDDYLEKEEEINGNEKFLTSDGIDFNQPNVIKYETDNKYLLFDRGKDGYTTKTWEEDTIATIYDVKKPNIGNYFTLLNRTKSGETTKTIDELLEKENKKYNILNDLYRNALAFQIKDNGSIGFKYLVKDCDSEKDKYKIEELFTKDNIIKDDEWYTISVKIVPLCPRISNDTTCDDLRTSLTDKMVIYIYVNGMLRLKSHELPILNLKPLDDLSDKQQTVPYSISLGGGTQGLCDVININYRELPKYILPLEKEFCGSFIGYIQSFRFYSCPLNLNEIRENYNYDVSI